MRRRPPNATRTDTLLPYTTLFRSRGDERIGAVIDIEQHALRAFEQDALARRPRIAQHPPGRLCERQYERRDLAQFPEQPRAIDRRLAEPGAPRVVVGGQAIELGIEIRSEERRGGKEGVSTCRFRGSTFS